MEKAYSCNTQQQFVQCVQNYVQCDSQILFHSTKQKELREQKEPLQREICNYMEKNNIEDTLIKITDGSLKYKKNVSKEPITLTKLKECCDAFFNNKQMSDQFFEFVKNQRNDKTSITLQRSFD